MSWLIFAAFLMAGCLFAAHGDNGKPAESGQPSSPSASPGRIVLFLCGDVMTGRGIDQIMPHPGDPQLYEPWVKDAREYVRIAEQLNGPIRKPAAFPYIWGDALDELAGRDPDVRIINLETSATTGGDHWPGKSIHYRMHPENVSCLMAADIDVCVLGNNHVLDWGCPGLEETLETLERAGIETAGAGRDEKSAEEPAVLEIREKGRVIVFSLGSATAGVPDAWAAAEGKPGVDLLMDLGYESVQRLKERIRRVKRENDVVVVSIHWGSNWGYGIPSDQKEFAHRLIDTAGVDVVHGHSSHHPRPVEVYKDKLILYGCGDFLNDYEGIGGYEGFRPDLSFMYFVGIDPETGELVSMEMVPMQIKNFRLNGASPADVLWLRDAMNRICKAFGTRVELAEGNALVLKWR